MSWREWRELHWTSIKFGLACFAVLAGCFVVAVAGWYLRIRWQRPITLSEFRSRLKKLL